MTTGSGIACLVGALLLSGCTHSLGAPEAVFVDQLATANKAAFSGAIEADRSARRQLASLIIKSGGGRARVKGCKSLDATDCAVTYSFAGGERSMAAQAQNASALLGSITRYATQMSALAKAEDLDAVRAKAQAAAGSVKALALIAAPPIAATLGVIIDASVFAGSAGLRDKRRRAMLRNAVQAHRVMGPAATTLNTMTRSLRSNIAAAALARINRLEDAVIASERQEEALVANAPGRPRAGLTKWRQSQISALRERRAQDFIDLNNAVDAFNEVGQLKAEFGALVSAHERFVARLRSRRVNMEDAMKDIDVVLTLLDRAAAINAG